MPACPNCAAELKTVRYRDGLFFICPRCNGRAVTLPQIRRVAGDHYASNLLHQINANKQRGGRPCPFCARPMRQFRSQEPFLELDACKGCGLVWFDPKEFEAVPEGALESPEAARLRGIEAEAMWRLERTKEPEFTDESPEETWKTIPAFFGFPVETDTAPLSIHPWLTWSLALLIAVISVRAFFDLEAAVRAFAFIPADLGVTAG